MAGYKARLQDDLDRWIAEGLVPPASREPILAGVAESRRIDAGAALAVMGALLAGLAAIAFIAATWDAIPRLARFALVIAVFLGVSLAGAAAAARRRPLTRDALLGVASLLYAGAIGLTGQIFDIAGDPQAALYGSGVAAAALALAGRSVFAAVAAVALIALGDVNGPAALFAGELRWLAFAAPLAAGLALFWRAAPLAHIAGPALVAGWLFATPEPERAVFLATSLAFALVALLTRLASEREMRGAGALYAWAIVGALAAFAVSGLDLSETALGLGHRLAWLALACGAVALGLHDRAGAVTAAGVIGGVAAVSAILFDLGLGLMTAAGVFAGCAIAALVAGGLLRRRRRAA